MMKNNIERHSTCAIVVTFNPEPDVRDKVLSLSKQVDFVYLVDNSPEVRLNVEGRDNVINHWNGNRGGLAGALNFALAQARQNNVRYVFLFDQDTHIPEDFCSEMLLAHKRYEREEYGIYGPRHVNSSTGQPVRLGVPTGLMCSYWPNEREGSIEALFLINSCSLLDMVKLPVDLHYDEEMAVDMIDIDFCLAARARGVKSLCMTDMSIRHGIGNRKEGSFIFSPTNYGSYRKYLQTRNRFAVWWKYLLEFPRFVLSDAAIWVLDSVRTIGLEPNRWSKLCAISRGIVDGCRLARRQVVIRSSKG